MIIWQSRRMKPVDFLWCRILNLRIVMKSSVPYGVSYPESRIELENMRNLWYIDLFKEKTPITKVFGKIYDSAPVSVELEIMSRSRRVILNVSWSLSPIGQNWKFFKIVGCKCSFPGWNCISVWGERLNNAYETKCAIVQRQGVIMGGDTGCVLSVMVFSVQKFHLDIFWLGLVVMGLVEIK